MTMVTLSNILGLNALRNMSVQGINQKSYGRLASGKRINKSADDAAGLAISSKMTSQVRGLYQALRNAEDGISLLQTADGALNEIQSVLQRMRELFVQSSNDTLTTEDRAAVNAEILQLKKEVNSIASKTTFNKKQILGTPSIKFIEEEIDNNLASAISIKKPPSAASVSNVDPTDNGLGGTLSCSIDASAITDNTIITLNGVCYQFNVTGSATPLQGHVMVDLNGWAVANEGKTFLELPFTDWSVAFNSEFSLAIDANDPYSPDMIMIPAADDSTGTNKMLFLMLNLNGNDIKYNLQLAPIEIIPKISELKAGDKLTVSDKTFVFSKGGSKLALGANEIEINLDLIADLTDLQNELNTSTPTDIDFVKNKTNDGLIAIYRGSGNIDTIINSINFTPSSNSKTQISAKNELSEIKIYLQVGANAGNSITFDIPHVSTDTLGISSVSAATATKSISSITLVSSGIDKLSNLRSVLGAVQNRLEHSIKNLSVSTLNLEESRSRILDADMAKEMMQKAKMDTLSKAATSMLASANSNVESVLQLLK